LPFCFFTIKVEQGVFRTFILKKKGVIPHPVTLGEHLLNRRLALDLRQEDVARQLGTLREVYEHWERDERQPVVSEWPSIVAFLGYYPAPDECAADVVLKARRCQGMDQKGLAAIMGVIHQRLRQWEHGQEFPPPDAMAHLMTLAAIPQASLQ
jgi:DNA-binding transcriptional regulator YiaG